MKKLLFMTLGITLYVGYILAPLLMVYYTEKPSGGTITVYKPYVPVYKVPYKQLVNNKNRREFVYIIDQKR
jgi:hypothetical protein